MARSSTIHRRLYIHPAHRTVGVSGDGIAVKPYCWQETWHPDSEPTEPKRVVLVFRRQDADAQERIALFERAVFEQSDARCDRVEFELTRPAGFPLATFSEADAVVWLGRGLEIARHWSDFDVERLAKEASVSKDLLDEVAIRAAFPGHPVLEGVGSFSVRGGLCRSVGIPEGATCLLTGHLANGSFPVAWVRYGRRGRLFGTLLGASEDFCQAEFIRLVLNALDWVGGFRQ